MFRQFLFGAALLATLALPEHGSVAKISERMHVGDTVPNFLGVDKDGNKVLLDAEPGKVTVITFWATWCAPCRAEMPVLEAIQREAGKDRFRVVAINFQESYPTFKKANKVLSNYNLTFSFDRGGRIARKFGINAIPHMYMLNKRGEIAHIHVGYGEEFMAVLVDELNKLLVEN